MHDRSCVQLLFLKVNLLEDSVLVAKFPNNNFISVAGNWIRIRNRWWKYYWNRNWIRNHSQIDWNRIRIRNQKVYRNRIRNRWRWIHPRSDQYYSVAVLLGAICGSGRSMDRAAQSMDPYFAQESMHDIAQELVYLAWSVDFAKFCVYTTTGVGFNPG